MFSYVVVFVFLKCPKDSGNKSWMKFHSKVCAVIHVWISISHDRQTNRELFPVRFNRDVVTSTICNICSQILLHFHHYSTVPHKHTNTFVWTDCWGSADVVTELVSKVSTNLLTSPPCIISPSITVPYYFWTFVVFTANKATSPHFPLTATGSNVAVNMTSMTERNYALNSLKGELLRLSICREHHTLSGLSGSSSLRQTSPCWPTWVCVCHWVCTRTRCCWSCFPTGSGPSCCSCSTSPATLSQTFPLLWTEEEIRETYFTAMWTWAGLIVSYHNGLYM